jgi:hypothetical protein
VVGAMQDWIVSVFHAMSTAWCLSGCGDHKFSTLFVSLVQSIRGISASL